MLGLGRETKNAKAWHSNLKVFESTRGSGVKSRTLENTLGPFNFHLCLLILYEINEIKLH